MSYEHNNIRIGLVREEKIPPDDRVPFSPWECADLKKKYPQAEIVVQPSSHRCFTDKEYERLGIKLQEDLNNCDILMAIKEIPPQFLISNKTYLFFSHTIKKQPHNRHMLQEILRRNIRLIDYECLTDINGKRLLGFGHFAGVVGAHNGLLTWGKRFKLFDLKPAHSITEYHELIDMYHSIKLPPIKIAVTGTGRVARGVIEFLDHLHIKRVTIDQFVKEKFSEPVFAVFASKDLYSNKETHGFDLNEFHHNPEKFESLFIPYTKVTDLLCNAVFWSPTMPRLFEKSDMRSKDFNIKVIADISCDIDGSVPATLRATTIDDPVFGYDPVTEKECPPYSPNGIDIMAVSNLPNELPREASIEFGNNLIDLLLPELLKPYSEVLDRATIAKDGKLTTQFEYLSDYVNGID